VDRTFLPEEWTGRTLSRRAASLPYDRQIAIVSAWLERAVDLLPVGALEGAQTASLEVVSHLWDVAGGHKVDDVLIDQWTTMLELELERERVPEGFVAGALFGSLELALKRVAPENALLHILSALRSAIMYSVPYHPPLERTSSGHIFTRVARDEYALTIPWARAEFAFHAGVVEAVADAWFGQQRIGRDEITIACGASRPERDGGSL
jgi:hypothetical protein